jgi:hypothetical protein
MRKFVLRLASVATVVFLTACGDGRTASASPAGPTGDGAPTTRPGMAARYSFDFGNVCTGAAITNATAYDPAGPATVAVFQNSPDQPAYVEYPVGYGHDFYANPAGDFTKINVVACLSSVPGSDGTPRTCDYDSGGIERVPYQLDITFYAALTGDVLGTGERIEAPADGCPALAVYDPRTRRSYGTPDADSIVTEIEQFLASR